MEENRNIKAPNITLPKRTNLNRDRNAAVKISQYRNIFMSWGQEIRLKKENVTKRIAVIIVALKRSFSKPLRVA